ncbi:hypothetical protein HYPSUDRAFT_202866 [Hypholoma sublateritium FD-334 SS-4]|uniref:Uncharacterized protein n=1 Tax=Hypholoma sublateritium (strain FD-334 SS-4) TaxID=945553 RepID=A0A0D2MD98_HYPSF|nr:hypothetical protein HYPSUDRAFT_202866 [Hypholoma sublateritium FD-334 SS-4]
MSLLRVDRNVATRRLTRLMRRPVTDPSNSRKNSTPATHRYCSPRHTRLTHASSVLAAALRPACTSEPASAAAAPYTPPSYATPTHDAAASRIHAAAQRACLRFRARAALDTVHFVAQRARIAQHIGPLTFDTAPHRVSPDRAAPHRAGSLPSARTQVTRPPIPIPLR